MDRIGELAKSHRNLRSNYSKVPGASITNHFAWLRCRDSNPDYLIQSQMSYRWTTPQYDHRVYNTAFQEQSQEFIGELSK